MIHADTARGVSRSAKLKEHAEIIKDLMAQIDARIIKASEAGETSFTLALNMEIDPLVISEVINQLKKADYKMDVPWTPAPFSEHTLIKVSWG